MDELEYKSIIEHLRAPFPPGTVQKRGDNNRAYIPIQVYNDRVETATSGRWSLDIKDIQIDVPNAFVCVIVRVTIGEHYRDGKGFAVLDLGTEAKSKTITNKVDQAYSEALREALDTWEMGWKDLAPHYQAERDWASNPALHHLMQSVPPVDVTGQSAKTVVRHECNICHQQISHDDWEFLRSIPAINLKTMKYCFKDLPGHLKKKAPADVVLRYEQLMRQQ
ncbi:hypothetical protein [Paenibacillus sp. MMO-58]|uniref:hypothetical protein n=1 Tax=Paenibacillus sp. MMO-58 TaxID=3081290 RepID=UPI00301848A3